jgi:sulfate permease, SulP family
MNSPMSAGAPGTSSAEPVGSSYWRLFVPKIFIVLRRGYGLADLRHDAIAGLTVAIVALPLAMAIAIASGATPDKGLITAIVAGFLISALGGSRFQIGGPTGAFIVVVFGVIQDHGYAGLLIASIMAGIILVAAGFMRLGDLLKYVPGPVVTGFTAGIAVIILASQLKNLLGLGLDREPAEFIAKLHALWAVRETANWVAVAIAGGAVALILGLRRLAPRIPGFVVAVAGAAVATYAFGLPVETIGSRFGELPSGLPSIALPEISWGRLRDLMPSALLIAFLGGMEALLSAVVADGMAGTRHRSNIELVGQGVANIVSPLFGGLCATGAIARTATNIRAGARSPMAGILHAVFLLAFLLWAAPLARHVPLAALAAVLVIVAWNMAEPHRIRHLLKAPHDDRLALLITFALTVLLDLTVAIAVGVVLTTLLFMHRMAGMVEVQSHAALFERDVDDFARAPNGFEEMRAELPDGVEAYVIRGPFFFGAAGRLASVLDRIARPPKVFILRMRQVPFVDASGASALAEFIGRCRRNETAVILSGLQPQPAQVLRQLAILNGDAGVSIAKNYESALEIARGLIEPQRPPEPVRQ